MRKRTDIKSILITGVAAYAMMASHVFAQTSARTSFAKCPVTLPTSFEEGCEEPGIKPIFQKLGDGQLVYVPHCSHGANTDYSLVHFAENCTVIPSQVETMAGSGRLDAAADNSVTCETLQLTENAPGLTCVEGDSPRGYIEHRYLFDGAILRLKQSIKTDIVTDEKTMLYPRKK